MTTGEAVVRYAAAQVLHPSQDWEGWCLKFTRTGFGAPGMGGNALGAWNRAVHKHLGDLTPPRAVPFFFDDGHGGGSGHSVIALEDGTCYSSDVRRIGKIDRVSIRSITDKWGMRPLGWTEDINGLRVYSSVMPPIWRALANWSRRWSGTTWYYSRNSNPSQTINKEVPLPRSGYDRIWDGHEWDYRPH